MEGLRPDQVALLADHRFRAQDALGALLAEVEASRGLPDPDAPAFQALLRSEPAVQVSCAVALLAEEHDRIHSAAEAAEISDDPYGDAGLALEAALEAALQSGEVHWNPMLVMGAALHKLEARRLPFSASDVELMLDFGLEQSAFWRFPYTVAAAEPALAAEPGSPAILAALERAAGRLDGHWRGAYDPDLRAARGRIRALLAANLPRGLLDLSIVADGDAWAEPARAVLAAHADRWEGVPEVLAHFAAARGSRPTKKWSRRLAELLDSHPDLPSLSRELLEIVLEIDVVPTPDLVFFPPRWLLAPANETLLKGAVWSLRPVSADWLVRLLGRLTLRGAARSPDDGVPTPLSAVVANAAVDGLIEVGTDEARHELRRLLGEIRRRDLLKRIATALGEQPAEMAACDEAIRREKQRAVRAKANPQPQKEQRSASALVRTELAPRLRDSGFTARGRTFWRHHADRVDVLHVTSKRGKLSVEIGVWFRAPRRPTEPPIENGEPYPTYGHCDVRGHLATEDLSEAALDAEAWFLRWTEPAGALALLLSDEDGFSAGALGSPARDRLIGYLAPHAGRAEIAAEHLARAAAFDRELLESRRDIAPGDVTAEWEAWVEGLEADAAAA